MIIAAIHRVLFLCEYLKVWRLWVKHHQLSLLMTAIVDVSHSYLNLIFQKPADKGPLDE